MAEKRALQIERPETSSSQVLSKWLKIFSEHFGKEITPTNARVYQAALSDCQPEQIEAACKQSLLECRFLPAVADIRERLSKQSNLEESDLCLVEWEAIVGHAGKWNADLGWCDPKTGISQYSGGTPVFPRLSACGEYALRHVGGYEGLVRCCHNEEVMVFRKRDFEAAYKRRLEMQRAGYLPLTDAQARNLLAEVRKVKLLGLEMEKS